MKKSPLISVCIPVFETEPYLAQCLRSVIAQDFSDFEVVIVSDASRGTDKEGRNAKKIVQLAQRECDKIRKERQLPRVPFRFVEHRENRGLIEVRRTLCYESRGEYLTQLDSDDELEAGALSALYAASGFGTSARLSDRRLNQRDKDKSCDGGNHCDRLNHCDRGNHRAVDIIHGTSTAGVFGEDGSFVPAKENRYGKIHYGGLFGRDVFRNWLIDGKFTANTWGKLIRRELFVKAYEQIPYTECNMTDDVLLFFFLAQYAKSYVGIEAKVYRYRVNTGMTSARKIDTLHKWKMICSAASVFSVISEWIAENEGALQSDEIERIRAMTRFYLANNIKQLREVVVPELQKEARAMLCEYWGAGFVEKAEKAANA